MVRGLKARGGQLQPAWHGKGRRWKGRQAITEIGRAVDKGLLSWPALDSFRIQSSVFCDLSKSLSEMQYLQFLDQSQVRAAG